MSSTPSSGPSTTGSTSNTTQTRSSVRGKTDAAWRHCVEISETNAGARVGAGGGTQRKRIKCLFCEKIIQGGGINRFKYHLAGVKGGGVEECKKVSPDIQFEMKTSLEDVSSKKRNYQTLHDEQSPFEQREEWDEVQETLPPRRMSQGGVNIRGSQRSTQGQKTQARMGGVKSYFMPRTSPGAQPTIKSALQTKEAKEKVDLAVAKWMIDAAIPFNAVNSKFYQYAIDAIASMGAGYKGPGFHDMRGYLLSKNVTEVRDFVENFRCTWKETGCTIMADGWTDQCRRTLINFLVYCPRGTVFLKSVDATDASKTASVLYKLFREVVLWVGVENVVHMVTDNAANYMAAGKLLEQEFPTLHWSPCAAHCINLMLQDMGKLVEVSETVFHASKITKYVYNHTFVLHLMREHTSGREIIRHVPTRFATNFIALESILQQKNALRHMVTCREWIQSSHARDVKGKKFTDLVLDSFFWKECATIVYITKPLVRVLKLVDSENRPAMGYMYAAIWKARGEIVKRFQMRKRRVAPYLRIIDDRWDSQLHRNLHASGYWLNPRYQYDANEVGKHRTTISSLVDVIERYAHGQPALRANCIREMTMFKNAERDFGMISAITDRNAMLPDEWWSLFGSSAPNLQKLAIRILSQTCSVSGCERNWSAFEHIHTKKRNRLEHQSLNDLVYVHYNLRLQQRNYWKGRNYDPIDFEDFCSNELWVLEEEPPFFTIEEIEDFRQNLSSSSSQNNAPPQEQDDVIGIIGEDGIDDGDDDDVDPSEDEAPSLNVLMTNAFGLDPIGMTTQHDNFDGGVGYGFNTPQ